MTAPTPAEIQAAILEGPAMDPPAGLVSNFVNPENLYTSIAGAQIACYTIATVAVALRVYTKAFITREFGWDDCELRSAYGGGKYHN